MLKLVFISIFMFVNSAVAANLFANCGKELRSQYAITAAESAINSHFELVSSDPRDEDGFVDSWESKTIYFCAYKNETETQSKLQELYAKTEVHLQWQTVDSKGNPVESESTSTCEITLQRAKGDKEWDTKDIDCEI